MIPALRWGCLLGAALLAGYALGCALHDARKEREAAFPFTGREVWCETCGCPYLPPATCPDWDGVHQPEPRRFVSDLPWESGHRGLEER